MATAATIIVMIILEATAIIAGQDGLAPLDIILEDSFSVACHRLPHRTLLHRMKLQVLEMGGEDE